MIIEILGLALLGGVAAFLGALLGCGQRNNPKWLTCEMMHGIMAFGGGALLAAVSLVLIPEGMAKQPAWLGVSTFVFGGVVFMHVSCKLAAMKIPATQLVAMLLDFVPETIVLGAIAMMDMKKAVFLAIIIAAQNFPEGFNAYREIMKGHKGLLRKHVMLIMGVIALTGPVFAFLGMTIFPADSTELGVLMTFCSGGIFYLVFRDVAPAAKIEKSCSVSLGAVLGFSIGMIGHALV